MPFVPTSSLLLLLPLVSGAASLNVAIVGAGAGGSSAAYWLSLATQRAAPGTNLSITVYEQDNRVGGRSTTVYPYNDSSYAPVELGASIFSPGNKNMMRATTEFGFERISFGAAVPGTGIWDGTKFVYRSDLDEDGSIYDERYQNGPATSAGLIGKFLTAFPKVYTPDLPQFQNISTLSASLGFTPLQTTTLESYFDQNGVNANWTNEYITSTIRFNYGQDVSAINGVAGMTSLAATSAYSVKAGNFKVFETFLAKSGASLKLNTKVSSISKISKPAAGAKYVVTTGKSIATYDAVIVAAPLPLTNIKFVNTAQPSSFPKVDYLHLHVTLLSTTTPALLPTYFKTPANASALPGTILTTGEYGIQPEFNSIRYQAKIERNGQTEYVIKIFSKAKISDATLATLFGKGKVGWVYRKEWDAYPYFPPRSDYPPVKVDQGLYYVNSMEGFWSTMETETISSRNVVDLLSTELLGSGLCGAGGAKGPVTDAYVVGWDSHGLVGIFTPGSHGRIQQAITERSRMSDDSYGMQALGPSGSADKKDWLIGSATSLEDIVSALSEHGCCNLTSFIDPAMCSENAIAGGGFCDVYRGELNDGTKVAIKVLRVYDKPGEADSKQKILKRAAREIYYWSRLKHRNVLPLMGLAIFRGHMSMISGWMDYGDLRSYVKVHPRADCISLCIDVCVGLCYIHKKEMAHGDLKAANVMVSPSGVAMLADFGNSQLKDLTIRFTNTTYRGRSIRWTAPELLQEDNGLDVSKEADVYAFGMTALETLTGKVPYEELTEQKLLFMIASRYKHPARPAAITSDELWDLLAQCWAKEPSRRPTMKDVRRQLQGLSTSTTGGQNTANGAVPNPPLPRLHQLPPVLVQEQMPLYAQGNLNRLVQHRGPAVSMYTVASEPTAQKAKLGEGGMISNRPVLNKDTSLSSAKVDSNKGGWTNYSLREPGQLWIHLVPQEVADRVSDQERRRQEAINEVIYTERDFVRDLEYLRDRWMQPLRTEDVIPPERRLDFVQQVFWNIEDIIGVSTRLRDLLTQRQNADPIVETIGDVFSELVPHFQPFVQYGRHQLYGKYESEKERMTNPAFASFAEAVEQSSESRKLELNGYLTKPTTRLARYPLLLEVVLKHTPEDNPDRAAIPKVVKIVREFLGRVNEESGKTENRFNLLELDRRLLFNPGEEVDLKLGDEQRQLVYKGPLKGREGALNRGRDFQVFLFDHALLVVKSKVVDKQKRLKVFRRPIPLELLAVSISEANAPQSSKAHKAFIGRYLNDSTHGAPSPSAPARGDSQKTGYQLIISHIGKKGYSLALWASTFVARRKWLEHIMAQQGVMRERSKVFDTFLLSQDVFVGPPKVNCSVPYDYSRRIAYGTDVGVYFQSLYGQDSTPVKGIELAGVTQIDVLEDYQLLVVLSGRSVLTFPFNVLDFADPMEQMKQISMRTSYFKVGYCLGRTLVCVVEASSVSSTIKVLEPVGQFIYEKNEPMLKKLQQDENGALGVFREFHIPTESYSIHFLKTKLFVVCTKGFEVFDLETMNKQSLFHPADASLDLLQKREDARPLAIYKIDEEYLICYTEFAFYVSMSGWRSKRDVTIYWEGSPTAFVLHYPHVMAFDPAFVEIRHVSDGSLVQVIHGNNLRLLFADTRSSVVNSASIGGGPITLRSDRNRSMGAHTRPQQRQPRTHERDEIIIASRDKVMAVWRAPQSPRASDVSAPAA